jgi:hypothetical protein
MVRKPPCWTVNNMGKNLECYHNFQADMLYNEEIEAILQIEYSFNQEYKRWQ